MGVRFGRGQAQLLILREPLQTLCFHADLSAISWHTSSARRPPSDQEFAHHTSGLISGFPFSRKPLATIPAQVTICSQFLQASLEAPQIAGIHVAQATLGLRTPRHGPYLQQAHSHERETISALQSTNMPKSPDGFIG